MSYPNASKMNSLLSQICIERGWCLPPNEEPRIRQAIPEGVDAVVDTLIEIERGIAPIMCDKETRRWLRGKVNEWLFDPRGRGAQSDLPL